MNETWYAVIGIFKHNPRYDMSMRNLYGERILWKTFSFENSIELAEQEAATYAKNTDCKNLGLAHAFNNYCEVLTNGTEIYSLMRESKSSSKKYLDIYFDRGNERHGNIEEQTC